MANASTGAQTSRCKGVAKQLPPSQSDQCSATAITTTQCTPSEHQAPPCRALLLPSRSLYPLTLPPDPQRLTQALAVPIHSPHMPVSTYTLLAPTPTGHRMQGGVWCCGQASQRLCGLSVDGMQGGRTPRQAASCVHLCCTRTSTLALLGHTAACDTVA